MSIHIRQSQRFFLLLGLAAIALLLLFGPTLWAHAQINLISRNIARLWTQTTLTPTENACPPGNSAGIVQDMRTQLGKFESVDSHAALHKGQLACLSGSLQEAKTAWESDLAKGEQALVSMLDAATANFAMDRQLIHADQAAIGKYATKQGDHSKAQDHLTMAANWYEMAFAYTPTNTVATKLVGVYQQLGKPEKAPSVWQQLQEQAPPDSSDYWAATGHLLKIKQDWLATFDAYMNAAEREQQTTRASSLYMKAAQAAMQAKAYDKAATAYQRAIATRPKTLNGYLGMGNLYLAQKQYDKARWWFLLAQKAAPKNYRPAYFLGIVSRKQQQYEEALTYLEQALAIEPDDPNTLYEKAVTLDGLQRRAEAIQTLEQAIRLSSAPPESWGKLLEKWRSHPDYDDNPDIWWEKGQAAEKEKNWASAAEFYRQGAALAKPPDDYKLLEREALMLRRLKVWDKAASIYEDLVQRYPDKINAYLGRGDVARAQKRYEEALQWYAQAQQIAPDDYRPPYLLGLIARAQKRYDEALTLFDRALALKPEDPSILYYKATVLDNLKRRPEAIQTLAHAIELHPKHPESWQALLEKWQRYPDQDQTPDIYWEKGQAAEKEKDWASAAEFYRQGAALAKPPDDYKLLEREALMLRRLKVWDKAASIYEDLVQRYPDKINAYLGRGDVARAQKRYEEALQWYAQAQQIAPDDYRPPYYLGIIAHLQGREDEALSFFDRSLELKPENPYTLYQKAITLKALGRREEAIETLAQAIEQHPKHPEDWQTLLEKWQAEAE